MPKSPRQPPNYGTLELSELSQLERDLDGLERMQLLQLQLIRQLKRDVASRVEQSRVPPE